MIKKFIYKFFQSALSNLERKVDALLEKVDTNTRIDKATQILLSLKYKELYRKDEPLPELDEAEFRVFSQNGEDGILHFIFSLVGTTNKKCVEICAADGIECNTANLIINHGWHGLLIDGDKKLINKGKKFYKRCKDTFAWPPLLKQAWITKENINNLLAEEAYTGVIDLLSLDMDGVDYWILKELSIVSPRVIVLEYQNIWGYDKAVTVPYASDFATTFTDRGPNYSGASLPAFVKLLNEKGYRYVGSQRLGFNAFFIQNGTGEDVFPEKSIEMAFNHPKVIDGMKNRLPLVKDLNWIKV